MQERQEGRESQQAPLSPNLQERLVYVIGAFFMSIDDDWTIIVIGGLAAGAAKCLEGTIANEAGMAWRSYRPVTAD